jgi:rhamnosyltransferase subunit B
VTRIVFSTFGSLGDLHPYIALARELKRRGHAPCIATTDMHRGAVAAAGLDFTPVRPSAAQMGEPAEVVRRVFHPSRGPEYLFRDLVMAHVRATYEDLDHACSGADTIVTHPLTVAGRLVAEKRGLAWRSTVLSPLSLMSTIDPPLFASAPWLLWLRRLGVTPYRLVFELARRTTAGWEAPFHALRSDLGLPPLLGSAQFGGQFAPQGNLALFSRLIAESQADWPPNTIVCGFSRYDGEPDPALLQELDAWLARGSAPVVFTLGSAVSLYASGFFEAAIDAARALRVRALFITGQDPVRHERALAEAGIPPEGVRVFRYLPYSAVFPRASVNVHQGGIGTLGQALAAGRPQLVTPVALDQPDNARRAVRLGVARTLPFQKLRASTLADALTALMSAPQYALRAAEVAARVRVEDVEARAAALLA